MKALGIDGNLGKWLGSFLLKRTQSVKVEDKVSSRATVISGVPQGSVLAPRMFLMYISDMFADANIFIYVDDSKVSRRVQNEDDVEVF